MITNLPIIVGNPVVCQVIVASPFSNPLESAGDVCYSHDRFRAVGYPFRAKYNDYGYVEDIQEDVYTEDTLAYIRKNLIERDLGENKYHDHEVRRATLSWATMGDWLHGKRLLLTGYGGTYPEQRSVGMVMIHEDIYATMAGYRCREWVSFGGRKDAVREITEAMEMPKGGETEGQRWLNEDAAKTRLTRYFQHRELNNPRDLEGTDRKEAIKRLMEMVDFDVSMSYARKQWYPASGAGGQSEEWELFRRINEAGDSIAAKRAAELAEYEDEDEFDDE